MGIISLKRVQRLIDNLPERGELNDGYHSFNDLYEQRAILCAAAFNAWFDLGITVYRSHKWQPCVGDEWTSEDGWFIVVAIISVYDEQKQISYHIKDDYFDLFTALPYVKDPDIKFDGHTSKDVTSILKEFSKAYKGEYYDIGGAMSLLRLGYTISIDSPEWKNKSIFLLQESSVSVEHIHTEPLKSLAIENGGFIHCLPAIRMKNADGSILTGWQPSVEDLLSFHWHIVDFPA